MTNDDGRQTSDTAKCSKWLLLAGAAAALVVLLAVLLPRPEPGAAKSTANTAIPRSDVASPSHSRYQLAGHPHHTRMSLVEAQQLVTNKVNQFARSRLAITEAMAKKLDLEIPPALRDFFATVQGGDWDKTEAAMQELKNQRATNAAYNQLWGPILETYGVAEVAHSWPADRLLEYGQSILGSLRPGMVYVGGTDSGRFIPTLLNETTDDQKHIVLTQNALADNSYVEYLRFLYADQMQTLKGDESQKAFQDYVTDARKRVEHDQQFPNEPKQVRPGEDIKITDNRIQVAGQVAVMAINERLLQMIMDDNPNLSFAMEESFPFRSMYTNAVPLGPVMELRSDSAQSAYTPDATASTLDYWRTMADQIAGDPSLPADSKVREAYAKLAAGQAHLFTEHNSPAEAEQAYRYATDINPGNAEAVFGYVNLLLKQNRTADALQAAEAAVQAKPENQPMRSLVDQLRKMARK